MQDDKDTYFINLRGKANINASLKIDQNYRIEADCSITQERRDTNEDGTYNITYKAEPLNIEIKKDNGEVIKAKDPRRNSLKFRNYLFKIYVEEGVTESFDEIYDATILEALTFMPTLLRGAVKRLQNK